MKKEEKKDDLEEEIELIKKSIGATEEEKAQADKRLAEIREKHEKEEEEKKRREEEARQRKKIELEAKQKLYKKREEKYMKTETVHKAPEKTRPRSQPRSESKLKRKKVFYGGITENLMDNDHVSYAAKLHFSRYHLKCTPKSFDDPDNLPQCTYSQSIMAKESGKSPRYIKMLDEELLHWGYIMKIHRPGKTATTVLKGIGKPSVEFEFKKVDGELRIVGLKVRKSPKMKGKYAEHTIKRFKELCKKQGIE